MEVAVKVEALRKPPTTALPATPSIVPGVVVPMPTLLVEVFTVIAVLVPFVTSKAFPDEVDILRGSAITRDAN